MKQTKFITEGAALLAIYAILLLISMYVPILGTVVTFALPLPFILLTIRYKLSNVLVIFVVALFCYCYCESTYEFSEDNYVWIDRDCFRVYV